MIIFFRITPHNISPFFNEGSSGVSDKLLWYPKINSAFNLILKNVDFSKTGMIKNKKHFNLKEKYIEKVKKIMKSKIKEKSNLYSNHWMNSRK